MIFVKPSFYDKFSCIASSCRHSCCIGWEIDIDEETQALYSALDGKLGQELREKISKDGQPHFLLAENERCPFLREDGLCRIIFELGEEALCDICGLHPRFFNSFPGREEAGLGLCCEEVVRLLLDPQEDFSLIEEADGEQDACDAWREYLSALRAELLSILCDRALPSSERLDRTFQRLGGRRPDFDGKEWASYFLTLERMDESWTDTLRVLERDNRAYKPESILCEPRYERIFSYLLYRHLITADSMEEARVLLAFCTVSTMLIASLDLADPVHKDEHVRAFSAEIEYSDENVEKICRKIAL